MPHAARLAAALALLAAPAPVAAQLVGGVVVDDATGAPIPVATVLLLDSAGAILRSAGTDADGRFRLRIVHAGAFTLRAEHLGYAAASTRPFLVQGDPVLEVELRLPARAIALAPVIVRTTARSARLAGTGFYERRELGMGRYITEEDIEDRGPLTVSDMLRMEPSVRHLWVADENRWAVIFRGAARMSFSSRIPCFPLVVLDGTRLGRTASLDDLVHPTELAGIELYPSGNGAPPRFGGLGAPCGVIMLWTRR